MDNLNPTIQELNAFRKLMQNPELLKMIEQFQDGTVNQYPTKKETEKPKSQSSYKRKWLTVKEVAELKGISPTWANKLMKDGFFGNPMEQELGSRKGYVSRKVLREMVENTKLVGKGKAQASQQNLKPFNKKQETQAELSGDLSFGALIKNPYTKKPTINPLAIQMFYKEIRNALMEDKGFLLALSREVMRNLKFVTKLES